MSWRLLLLLLLVQPLALRAQESAPTNTESAIRALEEQERVAVLSEDLAALERLWSDRLMVNNPQNAVSPDRATVLDLVRRGLIRYSRFERQIEAIRVQDDIAIVIRSHARQVPGRGTSDRQTETEVKGARQAAKLDKEAAAAARPKKADSAGATSKAKPRLQPVGLTNGK